MYGRASDKLQARTRQAAAAADTSGCINASDAFRTAENESPEALEKRKLTERLVRVHRALSAIKAKRAIVDIERQLNGGQENKRQTKSHATLRIELVDEAQTIQSRLSRLNPVIRQQKMQASDKQHHDFGRAFMEVAKRMLAEPVYERVLTATLHFVGDAGGSQAHDRGERR